MCRCFYTPVNTTSIKEVGSGALEEFIGLQKRVERGECLASTPVWVERPTTTEKGLHKSDRNGFVARQSAGVGWVGIVFNRGIDPLLQIIEFMGCMTQVARMENLRLPVGEDGREICLWFSSKGDCNRSCMRYQSPLRGNTWESVISFIRGAREAMDKHKRKFDGFGEQVSHKGH